MATTEAPDKTSDKPTDAGKATDAPKASPTGGGVSGALEALDAALGKQTGETVPGASLYGLLDTLARQFLGTTAAPAWPAPPASSTSSPAKPGATPKDDDDDDDDKVPATARQGGAEPGPSGKLKL